MKVLVLVSLLLLLATATAAANTETNVDNDYHIKRLTIRDNVEQAMARYVLALDELTEIAVTAQPESDAFQAALNNTMALFCQEPGDFVNWTTTFKGKVVDIDSHTSLDTLRKYYVVLVTQKLKGFSSHFLSGGLVTVDKQLDTARFQAMVQRTALSDVYDVKKTGRPGIGQSVADYDHEFLVLPGGSVCVTTFHVNVRFAEAFPDAKLSRGHRHTKDKNVE
jgi:hypothetical protein